MTISNPILAKLDGEPTLVSPHNRAWFESCVQEAASHMPQIAAGLRAENARADAEGDDWWGAEDSYLAYLRPYVVRDGVLQIPVKGVLLHDFPYALGGWATGYDYIWRAFERGMADANVRAIALVVDSPGGMVSGCFEMVDKMYAMRGIKPIAGFATDSAYSAAYATISVADPGRIYVTRTGGVGSIGVVTTHVDVSKAMDRQGVLVTFIHAGKHKVDGNPFEALKPEVKERIQRRIDELYTIFVSTVARNRGLEEDAVRATEALTYGASEAIEIGLADQVGALDDALADFSANLDEGNETMADATYTQAQLDEATTAARAEGVTQGTATGATAERARINTIISSDAAADRPIAALQCALKSGMSEDEASAFLAGLPAESKPVADAGTTVVEGKGAGVGKETFAGAMDQTANPLIAPTAGRSENEGGEVDEDAAAVDNVFAMQGKGKKTA